MSRFEEQLDRFFYRPDEDSGVLFDAGQALEEPPPVAEEAPEDFLAFRLLDELYAIPLLTLREIVKVPVLTEIPRAEPMLLGVMNLRGEVLPVYDIRAALGLAPERPAIAGPEADLEGLARSLRILVVRDDQGDAGVLVDEVLEVVRLKPSAVETPPRGLPGGDRGAIVGLGRRREQLFILLDLEQVLP